MWFYLTGQIIVKAHLVGTFIYKGEGEEYTLVNKIKVEGF
jgi:hypothetical protein